MLVIYFFFCPIYFGIFMRTVNNITDQDTKILPLQTIYFYDISTNNRYYFTLLNQIISSVISATIYTGMDVLFGVFVLHVCCQLKILANNIEKMGDNNNFQYLLKIYIRKHYQLIRFADQIEEVFNLMLLAVFASVIITLCVLEFSLITVLSGNSADISMMHVIFDLQFMLTFIFLMFIYSWVGESLVTQVIKHHL
uniref:Olfactory receptor 106 n=1 Tax=Aulacocentrum confusum TaxID=2767324 RepID=A0A7G8Z9C5_9HYME|nr:olfactory receptor 106 [Aulacocentrum confusum]